MIFTMLCKVGLPVNLILFYFILFFDFSKSKCCGKCNQTVKNEKLNPPALPLESVLRSWDLCYID